MTSDADSTRPPVTAWEIAEAYEPYVGRWSRLVARDFLAWLDISGGKRWLDVGCGTGALSGTILERGEPAAVLGVDPSASFIEYARDRLAGSVAAFEVGDARALPVADGSFDAVVSGLMLNFVPAADQAGAIAEMRRAARPGGIVAAYVWDYAGEMQLMRHFWDAAVAVDRRHVRSTRACAPRSAGRARSRPSSAKAASARSTSVRLTCPRRFATSTTTGRRSWVARARRRAT